MNRTWSILAGWSKQPWWPWALLALLFVLNAAAAVAYVTQDFTLRSMDSGPHIVATTQAYSMVADQGLEGALLVARGAKAGWYPTAGYLFWAALVSVTGRSLLTFRLLNLLFWALLYLAMFILGRRIHSAGAGLLSVAIVSCYPGLYSESHHFGLDFPGTAIVATNILLLISSRGFTRRWYCVAAGVGIGAGFLIHPMTVFFVLVPAPVLATLSLLRRPEGFGTARRTVSMINAGLVVLTAGLVTAIWWFGRLDEIRDIVLFHQGKSRTAAAPSGPGFLFYLKMLPWCCTPFLLLVGLLSLRRGPDHPRSSMKTSTLPRVVVWTWLLGGLLALALLSRQENYLRYMLPLCPALALVTARGVMSIRYRKPRWAIITITVVVAVGTRYLDSTPRIGPLDFVRGGSRPLYDCAGPPVIDPALRAAAEAVVTVSKHRPRARRLAVNIAIHPELDNPNVDWKASTLLAIRFPGVEIGGTDFLVFKYGATASSPCLGGRFYNQRSDHHVCIGGAFFPAPRRMEIEQRYLLAFGPMSPAADDASATPRGVKLMEMTVDAPGGPRWGEVVKVSVWRY
jgi:4-amino-4-deoxy-L-arabinose transferase-like glycosyltransferase